jgi:hypothetical protein
VVPSLSIVLTVVMVAPVLGDIIYKATRGDWIPAVILISYIVAGALLYATYGLRRSRLGLAWDASSSIAEHGPRDEMLQARSR